ncbi:putative surface protein with fasciclin (FAS1) repeats [Pontibacter aydingkolensis]|uniref:Fasciclin domain-containing protein n=1 Tax=Pontibacter aydingkolensis TaxID=1911536 RepID=A0ABS7CYL6_9BACT|nr:fasciclin domain-containing protein [Pontibacter aydingkolensis]MBW7468907.1 fasciclin domain-containing protein [Pontibacter aydingkolensis]
MKKLLFGLMLVAGATTLTPAAAQSQNSVMVGGEAMYTTKDIVDNAVNSKDHTTLVAAVKAAGLVETLKGKGPFTVFAPTNDAFENLPAGTVETLLKPENKATLTKVLTYHLVPGRLDAAKLMSAIKAGKGKATLKTVSGGTLTAMMNGDRNIILQDEKGNKSNISVYNVQQSNGVIHVLDTVLLPN